MKGVKVSRRTDGYGGVVAWVWGSGIWRSEMKKIESFEKLIDEMWGAWIGKRL